MNKKNKNYLWIKYILVTVLLAILVFLWNDRCNKYFYDGARCFFLENRAHDIENVTLCAFWEEFIFRLLPFLISSILIIIPKHKWQRYTLCIILAVGVVCIQLQFGALHYNPVTDTSYILPTIIHGGQGFLFAATYMAILIYTLKNIKKRIGQKAKITVKNILTANAIAYCSSSIVHAISNVLTVLTQTF